MFNNNSNPMWVNNTFSSCLILSTNYGTSINFPDNTPISINPSPIPARERYTPLWSCEYCRGANRDEHLCCDHCGAPRSLLW